MTHEESNIEPVPVKIEFLGEALDAGIANIDAVQERKPIHDKQDRVDVTIDLPAQTSRGMGIDTVGVVSALTNDYPLHIDDCGDIVDDNIILRRRIR